MPEKAIGKGMEGNHAAGDDFYLAGTVQGSRQDIREVGTEKGFSTFQADQIDPAQAGQGLDQMDPFSSAHLRRSPFLYAAVAAIEGALGGQGDIQKKTAG